MVLWGVLESECTGVYGDALRDMVDDYSVLHGYLYSSRYITRDVMDRDGLNPNNLK